MSASKPPVKSTLNISLETITAQALGHVDATTRAITPPIHLSATYERDPDGGFRSGRGYSRPHNPSYDEPEQLLAQLEGGRECLLFASGMAAATAVFQSLLPGDHVIAPKVMYWALRKWLVESAMSWGLAVEFVDLSDLEALQAAVRPGKTRLIWLETPANPMWSLTDIRAAADIAHRVGARIAVDSTVASPVLTRPLELGADLVMHSASKYLNGHSDVLAGALICANRDAFWQRIRAWRRDAGAVLGPFEAWLLLRGMRTLFLRVIRCCESALTIARHFENHPHIRKVLYPGLTSHDQHQLALRQMPNGFGGMLSLRHKNGEAAAIATAANVAVFKRATSLGGVESLIEHRASIEGPATPVPTDLLRLSIGIEDPADLISDLEQALVESANVSSIPLADDENREPITAVIVDFDEQIKAVISHHIRPIVRERGGDIVFRRLHNNIIRLELSGSPGASVPLRAHIEATIRHYIPAAQHIEFVTPVVPDKKTSNVIEQQTSLASRIETVLADKINPAVREHEGHIRLDKIESKTAYLVFEQRCQGCAMAEVTLRQGVEVMLKEAVPELVSIVDVTDHSVGRNPFFKTKKG